MGRDPLGLTTINISRGLLAEKPGIFRRFSEAAEVTRQNFDEPAKIRLNAGPLSISRTRRWLEPTDDDCPEELHHLGDHPDLERG